MLRREPVRQPTAELVRDTELAVAAVLLGIVVLLATILVPIVG